jgi:transposase InsO family protein
MRIDNLLCIKKQFVPKTTDSEHNLPVYPNLARDMAVIGINQLWAADITYIRLVREFVYLAVIKRHLALCGIHVCLWAYVSAK